jgi:hypothetical protein
VQRDRKAVDWQGNERKVTVPDDTQLLFIASQKFESGKAVRGALLLTDGDTKPLEFRCTNPIRPTSLQNVLYGQMLEAHLIVELIGLPLVNSLRQPPTIILVQEPELLELRHRVHSPILQITKESSLAINGNNGSGTALLSSASGQFEPVVLVAQKEFATDIPTSMPVLTRVFNRFDLLEPFKRVATALEQVHQQKIGESK